MQEHREIGLYRFQTGARLETSIFDRETGTLGVYQCTPTIPMVTEYVEEAMYNDMHLYRYMAANPKAYGCFMLNKDLIAVIQADGIWYYNYYSDEQIKVDLQTVKKCVPEYDIIGYEATYPIYQSICLPPTRMIYDKEARLAYVSGEWASLPIEPKFETLPWMYAELVKTKDVIACYMGDNDKLIFLQKKGDEYAWVTN